MSPAARGAGPLPGYCAAAACTILWGANYSIAKRLLREVDPLAVAWTRAAAGVLFFGLLLVVRGGGRDLAAGMRRAAPLGALGIFANQLLFMTGLKRTSPAHSAILIALLPVFVLLISALERAEPISLPKIGGVLIAFGGATVIGLEHGVGLEAASVPGDLLTLAGVLAFSAYTVLGRPVLRDFGALRATALAFVTGGAGILVVTLPAALRQDWSSVSPVGLACLAAVVVLSTIVAYILYYFALSRIDPSKVATMMYLQPVVAALVAYAITGEGFSAPFLFGGGLILGGVVLAERG